MEEYFYISMLMASKLCHDLSSAINAVTSGLSEFSAEGDNLKHISENFDSIEMARQGSEVLLHRFNYFRNAFGRSLTISRVEPFPDLSDLVDNLFKEKDNQVEWGNFTNLKSYLNERNIKYVLNIFLLLFYKVHGANIQVQATEVAPKKGVNSASYYVVIISIGNGKWIYNADELNNILEGTNEAEPCDVYNIHEYFLAYLKNMVGSRIEFYLSEDNRASGLAFTLFAE